MYYEVAEGDVPAVQGMAKAHEGVLEIPLYQTSINVSMRQQNRLAQNRLAIDLQLERRVTVQNCDFSLYFNVRRP